jgi:hypothetical protein
MAVVLPSWRVTSGSFDSGAGGTGRPIEEVPIGPKDGTNRVFRLSFTPAWNFLQLFVNGDHQSKFVPRFSLSGNIVTFAIAPFPTDELYCWYFRGPASIGTLKARGFGSVGVGSSDVVDYGDGSLYNIGGNVSLGIWCKLPSDAQGCLIARGYNLGDPSCVYSLTVAGSSDAWKIRYLHDYAGTGNQENHQFPTNLANDLWQYVGISRNNSTKVVTMYLSDGSTIAPVEAWSYTQNPLDTDSLSRLNVGNFAGGSGGVFGTGPLNGSLQQHYIWSREITMAEHLSAAQGNPSSTNLILACAMGDSPEIDNSGNGGSGAVTGTKLVGGH